MDSKLNCIERNIIVQQIGRTKMRKLIVITSLILTLYATAAFAADEEFCTTEKLMQSLDGAWKSHDSYFLKIRTRSDGQVCFSIDGNGDATVRRVRDVVIINGQLKHFTSYTPKTDGYVVYVNLRVAKDKMRYHWFSSYKLKSGDDTYEKQKAEAKTPSRQEARYPVNPSPILTPRR